jgi:hypothetical protein
VRFLAFARDDRADEVRVFFEFVIVSLFVIRASSLFAACDPSPLAAVNLAVTDSHR